MTSFKEDITKAYYYALFFTVVLLVAFPVAARESFFYIPAKEKPVTPAESVRSPNDTKGSGEPARPAVTTEPRAQMTDRDAVEQILQPKQELSNIDEAAKSEEAASKEASLPPNIGIPLVFNDAVDRYIHYFSITKRDLFKRWLKRKRLYEPMVRQILQEHGLPDDLVYLAMIESGFNLQAYSPMKAAGPWQFIPETGKRYGLTVNHWIDERRDIQKSTIAAARYLQELFDQFDCWYLAAAAYNTGEHRIDRLIKRHDTKDFWQLRAYNTLPRETREYVPQLIAAAIISKNPEKYGLGDVEPVTPLEFVGENVPGGVPLSLVAEAASTDIHSVRTLNPEIRRDITPPGKECRVKLPAGTDCASFRTSLASILKEGKRVVGVIAHMTRRQDNVSKLTKRYGVSKDDLALVNGSPLRWKRGQLVYIPQFNGADGEAEAVSVRTANFRPERTKEDLGTQASSRTASFSAGVVKTVKVHRTKRGRVVSNTKKIHRKIAKKYRLGRKAGR